MAETRERIIAAGAGLVHELPTWDWRNLSAQAVGKRAGVSERTVHRHFSTERKLRDAVLQRLVEESGVNLDRLKLEDFSEVTARTFRHGPAGNRRLDYEPSFIIRGLANLFIDLTPA